MTREGHDLVDQTHHPAHAGTVTVEPHAGEVLGRRSVGTRSPDASRKRAYRVFRQPERLADLADRRAGAIGNHGRSDAGALAPVALVDILDHLPAPFVLEIDVDVGRLATIGRDEA